MNIVMDYVFKAPRQEVWNLLLDTTRLAKCIPGCEELKETGPGKYTALMKVGVASIKGTYKGQVEIGDQQPPAHYKLTVEGKATPGFVRGVASMDLAEEGAQETKLSMNAEAQVGGLIASVGQRFLGGIAKQMAEVFFKNIENELLAGGKGQ